MWFVLFAKSNFIEKKECGINVHGSRIYQAQKTFNISNRDDRESQEYPYIWICMNAPLIKSNSSYVYIFQRHAGKYDTGKHLLSKNKHLLHLIK